MGKVLLCCVGLVVLAGVAFLAYPQERVQFVALAFNPVGPEYKDGRLNPFSVPAIREAMNLVMDRERIVKEIYGGNATPWLFPVTRGYLEALGLWEFAQTLAEKYAHDFEKGKAQVFEEMRKLGALLHEGIWYYKGRPVTLKVVARSEDERKALGDYVAEVLRRLGFRVEVLHRSGREATVLVQGSDPGEGAWDVYTEAWLSLVTADNDDFFEIFYTPRRMQAQPWLSYKPPEELDQVARRLTTKGYTGDAERKELVGRALELCLKDSVRIWLLYR